MKLLGENIKRLRLSRGMTQPDLAEVVGATNYSTVAKWESGANSPRGKDLVVLSNFFGVSVDSLLGLDNNVCQMVKESSSEYNYITTEISAGLPDHVEAVTDAEQIKIPDSLMGKWAGHNDIYITRENGESMNKVIPHNSLIAVRPVSSETLKNGDIVVYKYDSEYAVKRFYKQDNKVIFRPDSNDMSFTDLVIDLDRNDLDIKIKGKVVLYIVELD